MLQPNKDIQIRMDAALQWLLRSPIRNPSGTDLEGRVLQGSFNSWYDLSKHEYAYAYPEITGYALTLLTSFQSSETVSAAQDSGRWLLDTAHHEEKGFLDRFPLANEYGKNSRRFIYTFDTGIIIHGLVNLYRYSKDKQVFLGAQKSADWLLSVQRSDGSLPAAFELSYNEIPAQLGEWSKISGSYHAKICLGIMNLYEITQEVRYRTFVERLLDFCLRFQNDDGRFETYSHPSGKKGTNLHPHCYSAEALLCAGLFFNNSQYIDGAAAATRWIISHMREDGKVPRSFFDGKFNYNSRSDILAQSSRLIDSLIALEVFPSDFSRYSSKLIDQLSTYQRFCDDVQEDGGFFFGHFSSGEKVPHLNSWCTLFSYQALLLHRNKKVNADFWRKLV